VVACRGGLDQVQPVPNAVSGNGLGRHHPPTPHTVVWHCSNVAKVQFSFSGLVYVAHQLLLALRTSVAVSTMVARAIELTPIARVIASSARGGAPQPRSTIKQEGARHPQSFSAPRGRGRGLDLGLALGGMAEIEFTYERKYLAEVAESRTTVRKGRRTRARSPFNPDQFFD
jgi:hypothetical protein